VFEALASGQITLDIAKAFGATSDQEIQARVFEQVSSAYYAPNPDSIRRMVLSGTAGQRSARPARWPRRLHRAAGGRIERELFDDDDSDPGWMSRCSKASRRRRWKSRRRRSPPSRVSPGSSPRSILCQPRSGRRAGPASCRTGAAHRGGTGEARQTRCLLRRACGDPRRRG
jgi:hypothetical protein